MSIWQKTWQDALDLSIKTLKRYRVVIICTFLCGYLINGIIESPFSANSAPASDSWRILSSMISALWDLTSNMILFILSTLIPVKTSLMKGQKDARWDWDTLVSLAAESLRGLGRVLLWSLVLLVPGIIQYVRLSFVPYLVAYSKEYNAGSVDALETSKVLTKPILWPLLGITLIMGLIMIGLELIPQVYLEFHPAPIRLAFELAAFMVGVYGYSLGRILFHKSLIKHLQID